MSCLNLIIKNIPVEISYSKLGLSVLLVCFPKIKSVIERENRFYQKLLASLKPNERLVFDIGANVGWLTSLFLKEEMSVIAVEPDKCCHRILKTRFGNKPRF
ncbi:MAG: hypothetical protein AABZ60_22220, partial [Planctomycetota bacterium]